MRNFLIILVCFLTGCYLGEETPPDQQIWTYRLPKDEGHIQDSLLIIDNKITQGEYEAVNGLIIIKNDHLIYENYYSGFDRQEVQNLGKAGTSLTFAAVGVAEDRGFLELDDPIKRYLPDYEDIFLADPQKQDITIAHLLAAKSGLSWNEAIILNPFSPDLNLNQMKQSTDWLRFVLEQPMDAPAGVRFTPNTALGIVLAKVVEQATGEDFEEFLTSNLFQPLTITTTTIERDPLGNYNAGDGISMSLIDWTKFGYLMLENGLWRGRRILDPNFIEAGTQLQTNVSEQYTSGYFWQQFGTDFEDLFNFSDYQEIYFTTGGIGQQLQIIPSEGMVVAIFAENYFYGFFNPSIILFRDISFSQPIR